MLQSLNQFGQSLKPHRPLCWQSFFWLGIFGWVGLFVAQRLGVEIDESSFDLLISVSWLLTTIGGGWGALIFLSPEQYYSWKTVLLLSLFSWVTSLLANYVEASSITVNLLSTLSWIFLTIGVGWGCHENQLNLFGLPLSPWISSAILCWFVFSPWNVESDFAPALVAWPLAAAAIAIIPNVVNWNMTFKRPNPAVRQQLVLLFMFSLLLSGWMQFHFRIQRWLRDYPSLMADSFEQSEFVYEIPTNQVHLSQGVPLLTAAEASLSNQLNDVPWPRVERWLLNLNEQMIPLERQAKASLQAAAEQNYWRLQAVPLAAGDGYDLRLRAVWTGPTSESNGYFLEKSCRLQPRRQTVAPQVPNGAVQPPAADQQPTTAVFGAVDCALQTESHWGVPRV
ncbi:MAG: DUF5357 family protein [Cyanobacteria bacterium P01_A01_bin.123]